MKRQIGEACRKGGGHIGFDIEGGGCGSGIYAVIDLSLKPAPWNDPQSNETDIRNMGEKALRQAAHEIETALQFWFDAGRPGYKEEV